MGQQHPLKHSCAGAECLCPIKCPIKWSHRLLLANDPHRRLWLSLNLLGSAAAAAAALAASALALATPAVAATALALTTAAALGTAALAASALCARHLSGEHLMRVAIRGHPAPQW